MGIIKLQSLTKRYLTIKDGFTQVELILSLTGDIGQILPNGSVKIIDRKKNIFKLAQVTQMHNKLQGEYIAPEKIENVFAKCPFVAQIFVYGDSLQNYLVAIVVVDEKILKKWAETHSIAYFVTVDLHEMSTSELIARPELKKDIINEFNRLGREAKVFGFL